MHHYHRIRRCWVNPRTQSLSYDGRIEIHGCEIAAGPGAIIMRELARYAGVPVLVGEELQETEPRFQLEGPVRRYGPGPFRTPARTGDVPTGRVEQCDGDPELLLERRMTRTERVRIFEHPRRPGQISGYFRWRRRRR
jgi:hypothetical protein